MKISTKVTKKTSEFISYNFDYKSNGHLLYFYYPKFFFNKDGFKGEGNTEEKLNLEYKEVPEQQFIEMVTAELDCRDNKFKIGDTVVVNDDYLKVYDLMKYSGIPVKIIEPTIQTPIDRFNVGIPNNSLGGLNVPKHKLKLAGKTDKVESFNPQPHYDNSKGSLYKIATERNWNAYTFDVVKRLDRGGKKDSLRQEIEKSIDVLKIWLNELEN